MGRPKRLYPLGKYRLRTPKEPESDKAYPVELEYTWNRQIIRKTTNVFVKAADWNQNGNHGRGEVRASYGSEYKRVNQLLLARVDRIQREASESDYVRYCFRFSCRQASNPQGSRQGFHRVHIGTSCFRLFQKQNRKEPL